MTYAERTKRWRARWPERYAATQTAANRRRYDLFYAWMAELKAGPCSDCGGTFPPECMDFDHRERGTKVVNVSRLASGGVSAANRQKVLDEIAKCDLVCANCHRIRTRRSGR